MRFRIRATVKWRRATSTGSRRVPPGVGLAFLPSEASTREQLAAFVEGNGVEHVPRESRRHALHIEVKVDGHGVRVTDDISLGGCFLLWSGERPPMGTKLKLKLQAPGALFSWITLTTTVCWHRSGGDRDGVGVRFDYADEGQRRRTNKLLRVLKERLVREVRVQPPKPPPSTSTPPSSTKPPVSTSMLPRK